MAARGTASSAGVAALGDGDITYAGQPPGSGSGSGGLGTDGGSVDWNAIAAQVLANHAATGQWFA